MLCVRNRYRCDLLWAHINASVPTLKYQKDFSFYVMCNSGDEFLGWIFSYSFACN